jgi:predicted enzyme related to lactoylglutathione lyase
VYLENVVFDAADPRRLGRFWEAALGTETLTDGPEGFETRLAVPDGPVLDLCFQPVPEAPTEPQRLHLDLHGGADRQALVDRLLASGARPTDSGRGQAACVALTDPEGNAFCVMEERLTQVDSGALAALALDAADPERDRAFWRWLTGWVPVDGSGALGLRHPSGRGPVLELRGERGPKGPAKNRVHLDVRLERGDDADAVARAIVDHGGREIHPGWGDLPWRHYQDPSGNEFCVLPAPRD